MHLDANKDNCSLNNIRLGTPSENNLMKKSFGKSDIPNTAVPVVAKSDNYEQIFDSIYKAAETLDLQRATIGKILDQRPKNRYYKSTSSPDGKKYTFVKSKPDAVHQENTD